MTDREYNEYGEDTKKKRPLKLIFILVFITALAAVLIAGGLYVIDRYEVRVVTVEGNVHYSDDEIVKMVMEDTLSRNSLYLRLKYSDRPVTGIPFIERMDVDILSADTVRIMVYEKSLSGYVEYLGQYMYFDREGIVVEASSQGSDMVPEVLGLKFDHIMLNEKLPVEDENVFSTIINITHLLEKNELEAKQIFFDRNSNVYLFFGGVEVELGEGDELDEKFSQLPYILPSLEGKKGMLRMKEYTPGAEVTFEERR